MCYLTTPIYYVNDNPHIGHIYTTVSADVLARFFRIKGHLTHLLTGTDEHALKVVDAASLHSMEVADWAKSKASVFADAFTQYGIIPHHFIRTSEERHIKTVQQRVKDLLDSGDIYLGQYEGWYDKGQEEYISDMKAHTYNYLSPINKKPLIRRQEPCLYFKLSAYADMLKNLIESDSLKIRPESRKQEILARISEGINDVPCSRPRIVNWGVPVPGHEDQTVYVWIDALLSYLTAVDTDDKRALWPPKIQLIGKDILWFHAVIWPAMLLALQKNKKNLWIALPELIKAHAFWTCNGEKMSKSMGNFISLQDLNAYSNVLGHDAIRFFLIVSGPNESSDADFSETRLYETYCSLLANTFGNCCTRLVSMIFKYCNAKIPKKETESGFPIEQVTEAVKAACETLAKADFSTLISEAFKIVRLVNAFVQSSQPFQLIKDQTKLPEVCAILYDCLEALRLASLLLWPIMPNRIEVFWNAISLNEKMTTLISGGVGRPDMLCWGQLPVGLPVKELAPLFPRVEFSDITFKATTT